MARATRSVSDVLHWQNAEFEHLRHCLGCGLDAHACLRGVPVDGELSRGSVCVDPLNPLCIAK